MKIVQEPNVLKRILVNFLYTVIEPVEEEVMQVLVLTN